MKKGWQELSLQRKFLISVSALMLAALAMLSLLAGQLLTREVDQAVASEMHNTLQTAQSRTSEWLTGKKDQLQALARHLPGEPENRETWESFLTIAREAQGFDLVHIGTADGQVIQSQPPIELPPGADPRTRPWFMQAQEKGELILTPVYVDLLTGDLNMTLAVPLKENPNHILGGDLYISAVVDELLQQKMRWNSQLLMLDAEGRVLAHSNPELLQKELQEVLPGFQQQGEGIQQVEFNAQPWLASAIRIEDTGWQFLLLVDADEVQAVSNQLLKLLGGLALLVTLVSGLLVYWLALTLTRPLQHFQQQLEGITQTLNLEERLEVPQQTEWYQLASQTNRLLERIDRVVQNVIHSSTQLNASARNLAYTAGLVSRNSDLQDEVSQSMAAAVEEMSSSVAEITSTM
ncbi:methyl-accepting chemotaxis protein, partial [Marinospirillum sp.]|uniref:PDC sensor domain-containing protein n=1 Tax=Marinospirillum sp. TaxID=2183934 RepID=UPI002870917B